METQKTTARSILLPLALGTFSFCLTTVIDNKIFKNIPQRALMYGGSVAFPVTLITWGFVRNKKIDPAKLLLIQEKEKTEKILQALHTAGLQAGPLTTLVEARDWQALSIAIWSQQTHTTEQEPPKGQSLPLKDGQALTYYERPPTDKIIFTEDDLSNFNTQQLERFETLYTKVEVEGLC